MCLPSWNVNRRKLCAVTSLLCTVDGKAGNSLAHDTDLCWFISIIHDVSVDYNIIFVIKLFNFHKVKLDFF